MRRIAAVVFAALASVAAAPLHAQTTHPDFSGNWTLDVTKLEGPLAQAGITAASLTITQNDTAIKQDQSMTSSMSPEPVTVTVNYNLNGTESKNSMTQGPMTMDMTSTTSWDGTTLVVNTTSEIQGNPYTRTDRYNLDPSGKVLTIDSAVSVMGQNLSFKETFTKA
jgi:hypothetical protein